MSREPHPKSPGSAVGVDEEMIRKLVHAFYGKVRADATLGPIFATAIKDWDHHLATMCTFWSSVTLMTGRYKGQPMQAHAKVAGLELELFPVWLALFRETAAEVCPPSTAALFIDRAERIAESLSLGIVMHRGGSIVPELRPHAAAQLSQSSSQRTP
ncbi:group III truncated hemoglobin [Hyphomicrobium sp. CS1GBMeth3]|uniref:group III truncated hemoglobin n=1 Tax=Hyphomicrobium sp. CS1GBMeth3 TaxID=1892845 RepID=UPI000930D3B5|nr:group III truncated hemoglobin [Hyphomicrobium sp. CS1GBMeth3]